MSSKKKTGGVQDAPAQDGSQSLTKPAESKAPMYITTTDGKTIDKVRVKVERSGDLIVSAEYGKYNAAGKTAEEKRKDMKPLLSRKMTPDQAKVYQSLYASDPSKAIDYAVRSVFPMFHDDAAFRKTDTVVNGRPVNYIIMEKLDASKLDESSKHLAGSWQMSFGIKDQTDTRFCGLMTKEEIASYRFRAEVKLDDKGKIVSIGRPLSFADLAGIVETRVNAQREQKAAALDAAKKVDWSKFRFPDGVVVQKLRYSPSKDHPGQVWLNGKVGGTEVFSLLSKNESTAVRNKFATLEQVAAANKVFREKVTAVLSLAGKSAVTEDEAVKVIIDRASNPSLKAFTAEQKAVLDGFAIAASTPEEREQVFASLWEKANVKLEEAHVNEQWREDVRAELSDYAEGVSRDVSNAIHR